MEKRVEDIRGNEGQVTKGEENGYHFFGCFKNQVERATI